MNSTNDKIIVTHIDGRIQSIIINPTDEQMEALGSRCDDRFNYSDISKRMIGDISFSLLTKIYAAYSFYLNSIDGDNEYIIPIEVEI